MIFKTRTLLVASHIITFFVLGCGSDPVIETRHTFIQPHKQTQKKDTPKKLASGLGHNASIQPSSTPITTNTVSVASTEIVSTVPAATKMESAASTPATITAPPPLAPAPVSVPVTDLKPIEPTANPTTDKVEIPKVDFSKFADEAKTDSEKSTERFSVDPTKIGVILPLSGKNSNVGLRALNAIRLGFGLDQGNSNFSLALYDTQSNPDMAAKGLEKLLRDDHVIAVLGGLSAKEAQAISAKADFFEVPFFSFSQKSGLTEKSDYTFRNAITPMMQVEEVVRFAFNKLGAKRFAVLYPNDSYGVEFANKYWDLVLAGGGSVTAAQAYDPKDTDLNIYVQKLVGTFHTEARDEEYKNRLKEIALKNKQKAEETVAAGQAKKKNSREHEVKETILNPIVDFDVLFVPDSGKTLGQVIAFMKNNDVMEMTYLGTNIWNTSDLGRRAGNNTKNIYFADTAESQADQENSDFFKKYSTVYSEAPTLVEAQTFEAAKIVREAIAVGGVNRQSLATQLKSIGSKQGAFSEIKMNSVKEIERPLSVYTLEQGQIKKIE